MTILQISDLHGNIEFIKKHSDAIQRADVVVLSGDITNFGDGVKAREIIESIIPLNDNIIAVPGNCDNKSVEQWLHEKDISVHGRIKTKAGISFYGMGGSLPCPGNTPNEHTEDQMKSILAGIDPIADGTFVCVVHQPPFGTKADLAGSGAHVGSKSIRTFLEKNQPALCLTGHIHESVCVDKLNSVTIVNPGPARDGHYAEIEISEQGVTAELTVPPKSS